MSENTASKTVLVVDDEPIMRESLKDWLGLSGYRVEVVEDGEEALKMLRQQDFGVAVRCRDRDVSEIDALLRSHGAREVTLVES